MRKVSSVYAYTFRRYAQNEKGSFFLPHGIHVVVVILDTVSGGDNFYAGVSASPEYDSFQNQQPADTVSAEEQAAREQVWQAELAKVS